MAINLFIRRYRDGFHWFTSGALHKGTLEELGTFCRENPDVSAIVLIAPARSVVARKVPFSAKERKHLQKTLPFILEEHLLTEADDLHLVVDKPGKNDVDVVAVDGRDLSSWLAELATVGILPTHCIPEYRLLPQPDSDWQLVYGSGEFIIQTLAGESAALEAPHLALGLELLTDGFSRLPSAITLMAENETEAEIALGFIPEPLRHLVTCAQVAYPEVVAAAFQKQARPWNLLHGRFAPGHHWKSLLAPWRWVALILLVAFSLHSALLGFDFYQQKKNSRAIRAQMESVFRQVTPRGQVVDYRKQMEQELARLQGAGAGNSYVAMMNRTGKVLARHQVVALTSLGYQRERGEMKLDLMVNDYESLDAIIAELKAEGLAVEIEDSTAEAEKLRAHIRITGQSS